MQEVYIILLVFVPGRKTRLLENFACAKQTANRRFRQKVKHGGRALTG
jgi:hypothetical protein